MGYVAYCPIPPCTLAALGGTGTPASLFIETYVREGHDPPLRFRDASGARVVPAPAGRAGRRRKGLARGAVDPGPSESYCECGGRCATFAMISRAPGVGQEGRRAHIVTELKTKAPALMPATHPARSALKQELGEKAPPLAPIADAVSALTNLGYSRDVAANAVGRRPEGRRVKVRIPARLIRLGLKELAR